MVVVVVRCISPPQIRPLILLLLLLLRGAAIK